MSRRGRPSFKPTAAKRREVEELRSCGMSEDDVARALGISTPTLQKYFAGELLNGAARKRAEIIKLLHKSARAGNVSAQKKLEEMTRVSALAEGFMGKAPAEPKQAPPLGKKEQAAAAAEALAGAGGKYAPPAPPKLVVNNQ